MSKEKAVEYLDWYFEYDDGMADKNACKAWVAIKELLKAQEPVPPKIMNTAVPVSKTAVRFVKTNWCGFCGEALEKSYQYCHKCGHAVKWSEPLKEEA